MSDYHFIPLTMATYQSLCTKRYILYNLDTKCPVYEQCCVRNAVNPSNIVQVVQLSTLGAREPVPKRTRPQYNPPANIYQPVPKRTRP